MPKRPQQHAITNEPFVARCHHCKRPSTVPLPRYEWDGKVSFFDPVCVGSFLMLNPDTVLFFYTGPEQPDPDNDADDAF